MRRILVALFLLAAPAVSAADLEVKVNGMKSNDGDIRIVVIADPKGMARQSDSKNVKVSTAFNGVVTARFLGMAPGTYGLVASHDRHINHAFENAVTGKISSPLATSEQAMVTVVEPTTSVTLTLK